MNSIALPNILPKFGQINFINCLPVVLPIESGHVSVPANFIYANPAQLNASFAKGELDLSAMSSFFYLESKKLELIPTLSISCDGPVGSVLFFSKVKLENLNGTNVAVTTSSATSVNLLKVLLLEEYNVVPNFIAKDMPDLRDDRIEAALVIGDQALLCDQKWSNEFHRYDLGDWWQRLTGLPMVFGVWAASSSWFLSNKQDFELVSNKLKEALSLGLQDLFVEVEKEAIKRTGLNQDRIQKYFHHELNFEFTSRHQEGLARYKNLCQKYELLAKPLS